MPRRDRPQNTTRSEHWMRVAANERSAELNKRLAEAFGFNPEYPITWLSPAKEDEYAEYYDQEFLDLLGLDQLSVPLRDFWPASGPRWDALARSNSGKVILVEAKAYVEEAVDFRSGAKGKSLELIKASLSASKTAFKTVEEANWSEPFYQYANRLAHLYWLNRLNDIDAYLVFLYFADAPDVPDPTTASEWLGAKRVVEKSLGLKKNHPFSDRVATIIWSVPEMMRGDTE